MTEHSSKYLEEIDSALVIGAGHGIGLALVKQIALTSPKASIFATYRNEVGAAELIREAQSAKQRIIPVQLDPLNENEINAFAKRLLNEAGKLQLIFNAVGALSKPGADPERSLKDIDLEQLDYLFRVNAFVTPLLMKHLKPNVPRKLKAVFAVLSAMVGSIGDNKVGGWYGYRASKAALNMFIRTIAIELSRSHGEFVVAAIHPGTTETDLSKDYLTNVKHQVWQPDQSAKHIVQVVSKLEPSQSGKFWNWNGEPIPW